MIKFDTPRHFPNSHLAGRASETTPEITAVPTSMVTLTTFTPTRFQITVLSTGLVRITTTL
jgi:hypothetical protein